MRLCLRFRRHHYWNEPKVSSHSLYAIQTKKTTQRMKTKMNHPRLQNQKKKVNRNILIAVLCAYWYVGKSFDKLFTRKLFAINVFRCYAIDFIIRLHFNATQLKISPFFFFWWLFLGRRYRKDGEAKRRTASWSIHSENCIKQRNHHRNKCQ